MKDVLTPFFPCSYGELIAFFQREEQSRAGDEERIIRAANHAIAYAEARTNRRLTVRTYRDAVVVADCATADGDATVMVLGGGFEAAVKILDEVTGTGIVPGTRVLDVASDTEIELSNPAELDLTAPLTFGSERLRMDGTGDSVIQLPERPVSEVYSAAWVDSDGNETALDLTGARLNRRTGRYVLTNDSFPEGDLNILIGCRAGYEEPSSTTRGDFSEWTAVQRMCLRLAQCYFQDEASFAGRVVDRSLAQVTARLPDFRIPADVEEMLVHFTRLW